MKSFGIQPLVLLFCSFKSLGVFGNLELIKNFLNGSIHKDWKIIHSIVDTMVGHTGLRIVIRADLR